MMLHCQLQYVLQLILAVIYFFVILLITNTITTRTAITKNIPKPIPALKIPSITSQEVNKKEMNSSAITLNTFIFFIIHFFKRLNFKIIFLTLINRNL